MSWCHRREASPSSGVGLYKNSLVEQAREATPPREPNKGPLRNPTTATRRFGGRGPPKRQQTLQIRHGITLNGLASFVHGTPEHRIVTH